MSLFDRDGIARPPRGWETSEIGRAALTATAPEVLYQSSLMQTHEEDTRIVETVIRHGGQNEVRDGGGSWASGRF